MPEQDKPARDPRERFSQPASAVEVWDPSGKKVWPLPDEDQPRPADADADEKRAI